MGPTVVWRIWYFLDFSTESVLERLPTTSSHSKTLNLVYPSKEVEKMRKLSMSQSHDTIDLTHAPPPTLHVWPLYISIWYYPIPLTLSTQTHTHMPTKTIQFSTWIRRCRCPREPINHVLHVGCFAGDVPIAAFSRPIFQSKRPTTSSVCTRCLGPAM